MAGFRGIIVQIHYDWSKKSNNFVLNLVSFLDNVVMGVNPNICSGLFIKYNTNSNYKWYTIKSPMQMFVDDSDEHNSK